MGWSQSFYTINGKFIHTLVLVEVINYKYIYIHIQFQGISQRTTTNPPPSPSEVAILSFQSEKMHARCSETYEKNIFRFYFIFLFTKMFISSFCDLRFPDKKFGRKKISSAPTLCNHFAGHIVVTPTAHLTLQTTPTWTTSTQTIPTQYHSHPDYSHLLFNLDIFPLYINLT